MRTNLNPSVIVKTPKEILIGFTAAAAVEGDCWKEEVALVANMSNHVGALSGKDYNDWKKSYEQEFKKENNLKAMPGKYRSAKSVICKALDKGVELLDVDGYPRGKSEVEKECKEPKKQLTPSERCKSAIDVLKNNIGQVEHEEQVIIREILSHI